MDPIDAAAYIASMAATATARINPRLNCRPKPRIAFIKRAECPLCRTTLS